MTNRTTIRQGHNENQVVLTYVDGMGERRERVFTCPRSGGYVREGDKQVCERLDHLGATLTASDPADLIRVIRREWKAAREYDRRIDRN